VAIVLPKFPNRRSSAPRRPLRRSEPTVGLRLLSLQPGLEPNERLEFEYSIQRVSPELVDGLEISVMWFTEGKGSEDIGIHMFQRINREELNNVPLEQTRQISSILPSSPLSYEGRLLKLRWCVRLRLFLKDGREITAEKPFYLGPLTREV
jgi:hypothetical protein